MVQWIWLATVAATLWTGSASATEYKFRATCQTMRSVVQWNTGDIDPGREYLRAATGIKYPNCSISDYNGAFDGELPVEQLSGWQAVMEGIFPFVGLFYKSQR